MASQFKDDQQSFIIKRTTNVVIVLNQKKVKKIVRSTE